MIEYKPQLSDADETNSEIITNITKHLSRNLAFSQRITNLKSVVKENLPPKPKIFWKFLFGKIQVLGLACILFYFATIGFINTSFKVVHEVIYDSTYFFSPINIHGNNEIDLIDSSGKTFTKDINNILITGKTKTIKKNREYSKIIFLGIWGLYFLYSFIIDVNSHFKEKKLYAKINQIAANY